MYHNLEPLEGSTETGDIDPLYSSQSHAFCAKVKQLFFGYGGICLAIVGVVIVAIVIGLTVHAYHRTAPGSHLHDGLVVSMKCGLVEGSLDNEAYVFKGIPYAVSPVAELRWKPSKSIDLSDECWGDQTLQATKFSKPCFQYNANKTEYIGSEDCLYLNVWTPSLNKTADLDVMVYIHGGGLMTGSGNIPDMSPNAVIAKSLNKVFVSFNYRLNAFGFMALDVLSWSNPKGSSGNYGLRDQMVALQWVQRNIQHFGGNPNQVTIFGQGSGATSIFALLSIPKAKGLFQRAWLMSPSPKFEKPLAQAQRDNLDFLNHTGCMQSSPDAIKEVHECLHHLSPEDILNALPWDAWRNPQFQHLPERGETSRALAIVDGDFVSEQPVLAWKSKKMVNDVPLLIGNMAQEVRSSAGMPTNWADYDERVRHKLAPFQANMSEMAVHLYEHEVSPEYQLTSMVSDLRAICGVDEIAKVAASVFKSPVYRYVASPHMLNTTHNTPYAFRGMDTLAFFGGAEAFTSKPTKRDRKFAKNIRDVVSQFASDGRVQGWETFPNKTSIQTLTMQLNGVFKQDACRFWRENGMFPEFAWIN
ncbi:Cholinesterase [Lamellibrachia satsuma]|nr:Cholinesterase [Lamellibrachia satsuma]